MVGWGWGPMLIRNSLSRLASCNPMSQLSNLMLSLKAKVPMQISPLISALLLTMPSVLVSAGVLAHGNENHADAGVSVDREQRTVAPHEPDVLSEDNVLPDEIATIGGPFSLVNHFGDEVTEQTYAGKHMLVFFGYSNCQVMCPTSLKRMGDALAMLEQEEDNLLARLNSLVITVDPDNDTPEQLRKSLFSYHPSLTGLTGTPEQLKPVYKAYRQKPLPLEYELGNSLVYSHSSYFYLMGPDGKLQTFFPPILSAQSMAELIKKYLAT